MSVLGLTPQFYGYFLKAKLILCNEFSSLLAFLCPVPSHSECRQMSRSGACLSRKLALDVRKVPVLLPPFHLRLLWHEHSAEDPAHEWLRARIFERLPEPLHRAERPSFKEDISRVLSLLPPISSSSRHGKTMPN
jgi:hypothetical protein